MTSDVKPRYLNVARIWFNDRRVSAIVERHQKFWVGVIKNPDWTDYWIGPNRAEYEDAKLDVEEQYTRMRDNQHA